MSKIKSMKTNEVNNENVQGMFLCWLQVSNRIQKNMTDAERDLVCWLLNNAVHRVTDAEDIFIEARINGAVERADFGTPFSHKVYFHAPDELTSGFIRIERSGDPKACINIPVIDWRGEFNAMDL